VVAEEVEEEGVAEADMGAALVDKEEAMGVVTVAPAVPMGAAMAEVMEAATGAATEIEITIRAAVSEDVQEVVDGVEAVDEVVVEEAEVAAFATNFNGRVRVRLGTNVDFPTAKINPIHLHTNHPIHQKTNYFSYFTLFSRLETSLPFNLTSRKGSISIQLSPTTKARSRLEKAFYKSQQDFSLTIPFRLCY